MAPKFVSVFFFTYLLGSTLCIIPEGEYQIGPIFGGERLQPIKYFEGFFDKGHSLKPLLAKKAILGVGALGAGALVAGGVILAKKYHAKKEGHHGQINGQYNTGGWYDNGNYYNGHQHSAGSNYPAATDYQYQNQNYAGYSSTSNDYSGSYPSQSEYTYSNQGSGYYSYKR